MLTADLSNREASPHYVAKLGRVHDDLVSVAPRSTTYVGRKDRVSQCRRKRAGVRSARQRTACVGQFLALVKSCSTLAPGLL